MNWLVGNIIAQVDNIRAIMKNNRLFKAKQAEVAKMKAAGDMHEWINVPSAGGTMLVCKKTGYAPSLDGFIPMQYINNYLENLKAEEEYKVFRAERIHKMALDNDSTVEKIEKIVEQVFSMKKDFALMRIEKLQKELQDRAAAVNDGQNQV